MTIDRADLPAPVESATGPDRELMSDIRLALGCGEGGFRREPRYYRLLAQLDALAEALRDVAAIADNMEGVTQQRDDMRRVARAALALLDPEK